jgi:predicted DNA-binding transcriptional regulator AlpA
MAKANERISATSEYLKDHEAAAYLNLSVFSLRNWRSANTGPKFCRLGRSIRYPLDELKNFVEQRKVNPDD